MNLCLDGWMGPMLVPSTEKITNAYRTQRQSGIDVEALSKRLNHPVERGDFRTHDGHFYWWGVSIHFGSSAILVLFPWREDKRPVSAYVKGQVETVAILGFFDAILYCLQTPQVEIPTIEIKLGAQ